MERGLISVDRWTEGSQAYFLTHLHADHTSGLFPKWNRGPLFCSRITSKLLPFKFPGFNLSLLRILDVGEWISLSLVSPSSCSETTVEALAIDAHHCPGAVMYLFRGEFGCMLYTGDFRWEARSKRASTGRNMLANALKNHTVQTLNLDNTYCNPSYVFPSRHIAAQQVVDLITSHPKHDIIIAIDSLGKEDLLVYISRVLDIKIWVWPERLRTMHLLGIHDIFTTRTTQTRVRAVPRYSFSIDTLEKLNTFRPTIGIMPSGVPWLKRSTQNRSITTVEQYHKYLYSVPYSDHSCFTEIKEFVELVKPLNIHGIVNSSSCFIEPFYYFCHCCRPKNKVVGEKRKEVDESRKNVDYKLVKNRNRRLDNLGVHMSRVSILRREKQGGVKIDEIGSVD